MQLIDDVKYLNVEEYCVNIGWKYMMNIVRWKNGSGYLFSSHF